MVITSKEKYGEDYYKRLLQKTDKEKRLKNYKENRIVRNSEFLSKLEDNLEILQENILSGYIEN